MTAIRRLGIAVCDMGNLGKDADDVGIGIGNMDSGVCLPLRNPQLQENCSRSFIMSTI